MCLIVFRNNPWVKPFADFVNGFILMICCGLIGGILGFLIGYLIFGNILGVNISMETLLVSNNEFANAILSSARQKVFISAGLGALIGAVIYLMTTDNSNKKELSNNLPPASMTDELIRLNELKEKGIITQKEFDDQKKRILK